MIFDEYNQYDATGLAGLIKNRDVSASEVLETAINQIESLNPKLNAVIATDFDVARKAVKTGRSDAPLHGVPYLIKDLNTSMHGVPSTNGSIAFRDFLPAKDSVLISRLRSTGLAILGKTNTPEFGLNICTSPSLFGPTPNPFDPGRSAGGSSGGSACAVAAGMLPAAHATDSGGSIRIPSSNCGLFGLKPSRGRVPLGNDMAEGLAGFSTGHAITHSVRDSALLLDVTAGGKAGDIYTAPTPPMAFSDSLNNSAAGLRIALWTEGFAAEAINPSCQTAARNAAKLCEDVGCVVEEVKPPIDGYALRNAFDILFTANINNLVRTIRNAHPGKNINTLVEPATLACSIAASRFNASDYAAAIATTQQAALALGDFFEKYDMLLTPTLANPPLALGKMNMQEENWSVYLEKMLDEIPFTPLFNATGAPAMSVPLAEDSIGLPVGVQFGASFGSEARLLNLARCLELQAPWHNRI